MRRLAAMALAASAALALAACSGAPAARQPAISGRDLPADDQALRLAGQVAGWHRQGEILACDLMLRLKPVDRDAMQFTLNAWSTADGRTRLQLSKVGFSGFEVLVQPDGTFTALSRGGDLASGPLRDLLDDEALAAPAPTLGNLALAINDLKHGPLPLTDRYRTPAARSLATLDPATGLEVVVRLGDGLAVADKTYFRRDGTEVLRLEYQQYRLLDGLNRPTRVRVRVPGDAGDYLVVVQSIDVLPSISDRRMSLELPAGAKPMTPDEFLRQLGG